jgi:hypothetical protein
MSLNFPNTPALNDEHVEEGQVWYWSGLAWTIKEGGGLQGPAGEQGIQGEAGADGADGVDGTTPATETTTIGAAGSNWTINGHLLTCWGYVATDGTGNGYINFPKNFAGANNYQISLTPLWPNGTGAGVNYQGNSAGGVGVVGYVNNVYGVIGVSWVAVGLAAAADQLPLTVKTVV